VGYDDYAEALVAQIPAACAFPGLGRPRFSILSSDAPKVRARLSHSFPQLSMTADCEVIEFDVAYQALDVLFMQRIDEASPVTAVFVSRGESSANLATALGVREAMRRHASWRAPVYVRLNKCTGVARLLIDVQSARRFGDVIEAFGVEEQLCDLTMLEGPLEEIAERFHTRYLRTRESIQDDTKQQSNAASLSNWRSLDESLRDANRRAADHMPAKIGAAGALFPNAFSLKAPVSFRMWKNRDDLEALAELEHRSWMADRYLDGWQYDADRDDARRRHPALLAYGELDDSMREFDRSQIKFLDRHIIDRVDHLARSRNVIRPEVRLGVIACAAIDPDSAAQACAQLESEILPKLFGEHPDSCITVISALMPGPDLIAIRCILQVLETNQVPHSLIAIEEIDSEIPWERLRHASASKFAWHSAAKPTADEAHSPELRVERARAARDGVIQSGSCDWVVELDAKPARNIDLNGHTGVLSSYLSRKSSHILRVEADSRVILTEVTHQRNA
jgi:hypothetical protein